MTSHTPPLEPRPGFSYVPQDAAETLFQGRFPLDVPFVPKDGDTGHLAPAGRDWVSGLRLQRPEPSYYPESKALSHNGGPARNHKECDLPLKARLDGPVPEPDAGEGTRINLVCPKWGITGECGCGHVFAKELICNREWCPNCGGDGGKSHLRRTSDKLARARQIESMGKFVITIPPEIRWKYRDPLKLAAFGVSVKRMMQYNGFNRGLRRFHYFGEDHKHGPGYESPTFHPHLEVIVEAGYLSGKFINKIKRAVAHILGVNFGRVNLFYSYSDNRDKKLHFLRYMLRPTFESAEWDSELAYSLIGFKNALSWGTWHHKVWDVESGKMVNGEYLDPVWDMPDGGGEMVQVPVALQLGFCPVDGSRITWAGTIGAGLLKNGDLWTEVGGGYWLCTGMSRDGPFPGQLVPGYSPVAPGPAPA